MTQPLILWDYLRLAMFPSLNEYGPFHDDVKVVTNYKLSLIAVAGFIVLLSAGFYLRRSFPLLLFAILWFFIGHLVESSVIMLEFYFEHRNYVAIYGIFLMLAAAVFMVEKRYRIVLFGAFVSYVFLQLAVLTMLANIWGKPLDAAEHWAKVKPQSSRAIMALSESYFRTLGDPVYANTALDRGLETCAECLDVYMQALIYGCLGEPEEQIQVRYERLLKAAPYGHFTPALIDGFYPLREFVGNNSCGALNFQDVEILLFTLQKNLRFKGTANKIHLTYLKAVIAADQKKWEETLAYLDELSAIRTIFGAVTLKSQTLQHRDGLSSALAYLAQVQQNPGDIGEVDRAEWDSRLQDFIDDMNNQTHKITGGNEND